MRTFFRTLATACWLVAAGAVWVACLGGVAFAQEWTEARVVDRFMAQNPWARDARARSASAAAEARNRSLAFNPRLRYIREGAGLTEFLQLEQTIHWSGRLGLLRQSAEAAGSTAQSEGAFDLWEARSNLRLAFYQALAGQERGAVYERTLQQIDEVIRILTEREREGEISRFDRLRAERERAELVAEWELVRAETVLDLATLRSFLPAEIAVDQVAGRLETTAAEALPPEQMQVAPLTQRALAARQDYQAEVARLQWFGLERRAASRLRVPEPSVSAGYKRADIGVNQILHGGVVEVNVPLPLFNRGQAEVARFSAEQERALARQQILAQQIRAVVDGNLRAFQVRRNARDRFRAAIADSGAELVRIANIAYLEGEIAILQLLDAYRADREAQLRMLDIELAVKEAQIELERVMGEELAR
jgi:outer membrane protein, heavy metal efflux system